VTTALVLGALVGLAALAAYRALFPPVPPLEVVLRRLDGSRQLAPIAGSERSDLTSVVGRTFGGWLERVMLALGVRLEGLEPDLRLVGSDLQRHLGTKVLLGLLGLVTPPLVGSITALIGVAFPGVLTIGGGLVLGAVFFFVPDLTLRSEADKRRRAFRHGLGSFLDLVVIGLAGGAGVESALHDAAAIGEASSYDQLRRALEVTSLTGETPWAALARLGDELGVSELAELASSVSLAGTEGARVRDSLAAKARSLRDHALASAEAEAQSATERMAFPVVLLFLGFMVLVGYPAVDAVLTGF
jgi:tight adherence protein C